LYDRSHRVFLLVLCLVASFAGAQVLPAQDTIRVTLGPSVVPLYGPWKFSVGDSPLDPVTGAPLWAQPNFNDSAWETVDLTPNGTVDPLGGFSDYVKGWTAKGHPNHSGYGWYRLRVQMELRPGEKLALAGPAYVDDAYEVYSNGVLVGSFGKFVRRKTPVFFITQPMMFDLPASPAESTLRVLAFRLWMSPDTMVTNADTGGIHTAPLLGDTAAVRAGYELRWLEPLRAQVVEVLQGLLFLILASVSFSLTRFDRSDRVYVWMGAVFLLIAIHSAVLIMTSFTLAFSAVSELFVEEGLIDPLLLGGWVMVWWIWFQLQRPKWVLPAVGLLTIANIVSITIGEHLFYPIISIAAGDVFHTVSVGLRLAQFGMLILVVILGMRRQGAKDWFVLPAVALMIVSQFRNELLALSVRIYWFPFGIRVSIIQMANILLTGVLFVLLLRRLQISLRQQRLLALDVKQAQEVQRVIMPEVVSSVPGLTIENEYRPAREVGGDFNQIVPLARDGSVLIVAGDVTGKGLQAGMLVALLVGAVRMAAEINPDPLFVLEALNRRLLGRGEAHATCLAMRIAADGSVTLANAGHLPPYLNGKPILMDGALPLGMIEGAEFSVTHFALQENDRLVLASDGIVEAMDDQGRLFGFERMQELVAGKKTAADLAAAAQAFGQQDDISVIAITRTAALVPA
jgi:hypothetical protein